MESKRPPSEFVRLIPIIDASEVQRVEDEKHGPCALSAVDCASGITLSDDRLAAWSRLGYRTVRASRGIAFGYFYYEAKVVSLGETGAIRVGVQTQWADLHGPVGIDTHGYGVCSVNGDAVSNSQKSRMGRAFTNGDVVGVALYLPSTNSPRERTREPVVWGKKSYWAQETPAHEPVPVAGSFVEFYVNGVTQGRMENLMSGTYFPAISLFTAHAQKEPARARVSFKGTTGYPPGCTAWNRAPQTSTGNDGES